MGALSSESANLTAISWLAEGSRPATEGQVEGIADREVVGAVQALAPHPQDPDELFIGAVNGGLWRTENATAPRPTWRPLLPQLASLSIGALAFDPTDPGHDTLVAGTGRFSSNARMGGALLGVLRTADRGVNWTLHDGNGLFRRFHICGLAARGSVIVAATRGGGLFRSSDTGASWSRVSGDPLSGLPAGDSFDLAGDPSDPARLFTNGGRVGLFRSTDSGATWTKVSNTMVDAAFGFSMTNLRISVGSRGNVYLAVARSGRLSALFRSGDLGASWRTLDLPITREKAGAVFGAHPGGQAGIHFSLAADLRNENLVYLGGDRQPGFDERQPSVPRPLPFPNSIGAGDYSGRLFRIDAARPTGFQATPLTHSDTANNSAPHADSRHLIFMSTGQLLEADDGGVYRRTHPERSGGDWFSVNGDLQVSEYHSVAWDANTQTVIGGAQDTGSQQQRARGDDRWFSVSTGDGGTVAVDSRSTPGTSTRFSSYQNLSQLRREVYDSNGLLRSRVRLALRMLGNGAPLAPQFYTPINLNHQVATRLIIGAANGVYESDDQGDTVRVVLPRVRVNASGPIAYGAAGNPDMLYVGSGSQVLVRRSAPPARLQVAMSYQGGRVVGLAVCPDNPDVAFAIDMARIFRTTDAGVTWIDITGNIAQAGASVLRSVAHCPDVNAGLLAVGTNTGVYFSEAPDYTAWSLLGLGLPAAPVLSLQYSESDRLMLAGTLGRGAWTLRFGNS